MSPTFSNSRVGEVWRRLQGMFGVDAVKRKFGDAPPVEWEAMLSRLKDFEVDRGLRRLAYSGKSHVPSLPEFAKLCRMVADDDVDEGPRRIALPNPDTCQGDKWDQRANKWLLKYILTRGACGIYYSSKRDSQVLHRGPEWQADDQTCALTQPLVENKNAWAAQIRECEERYGIPDIEEQRELFAEYMRHAEERIILSRTASS